MVPCDSSALADRVPIAAFVIDLHLADGRTGLEFVEWLRTRTPHDTALVYVVTGELDIGDEERRVIERAGARTFLKGQSPRLLAEDIHWRLFSESDETSR